MFQLTFLVSAPCECTPVTILCLHVKHEAMNLFFFNYCLYLGAFLTAVM